MKTILDKIKELAGTRFFFFMYLVFFGAALLLCASSDALFDSQVVKVNDYKIAQICKYAWTRNIIRAIAVVHFLGGVTFFIRLCVNKLEIDW